MSLELFLHPRAASSPPARISIRRRLLGRGRRLRTLGMAAGLLGLGLMLAPPTSAGTVTWDGVPADWFSNPSHWTNGSYPGAGDDARNTTTAAMTLGQSTTVNSFFSNGAFTLNGGTFSGNQANATSTLQVNNLFTVNGGQINNFTLNQGTGGSVVFTTNGGNSLSSTIVNANLDFATNGNAYAQLFNTNTFNGAVSLGAGGANGLHLYNSGSTLIIGGAGSLTGFGSLVNDNGGATVTNNGLINANSSVGSLLTLGVSNFNNTAGATLQATNGGALNLSNTATANSGAVKATGTGSVVTLTGGTTFTGSGSAAQGNLMTASGGGRIVVDGAALRGTINTAANTALIFTTNGSNNLDNTTVNGNLDFSTNSNAYVLLFDTDTINGNISLGAGGANGLHLYNSSTNLVLNGALTGFGSLVNDNGGATVNNNGLVNANSVAGSTLTTAVSNFNNNAGATLEATNGGTLAVANTTTTNNGLIAATGGGTVNLTGTLVGNSGSSINTVGGRFNVTGASLLGTLNGVGASSLVFDTNGSNRFDNTTANINLDFATNSNAYALLLDTDTVNGNISLGAGGANGLHLYNSSSNLVLNGALTGFGSLINDNGGATVTANGLINSNVAGNTLTTAVSNFNNNAGATLEATNGGTLAVANTTTTNNGLIAATGGGTVNLTGTLVGNSGSSINTVGGRFNVTGASLLGTLNGVGASSLVFDTNGSNRFDNTTANINLDFATNSNAYVLLLDTDTVNGNISLGAGGANGLHLYNSSSNLVLNGALTGFGSLINDNGGATVTANGLINSNVAGNTLTTAVSNFNNNASATLEATGGGRLSLSNTNTNNSGAVKSIGAGSVVTLTSGTTFTGSGSAASGNLITASGGGQIVVNGSALRGTINTAASTALVFTTDGSNNLDNTTVNGNLDFATNSNAYVLLFDTNTVNGNISLGAGGANGLHLYNSSTNLILGSPSTLTGFGSIVNDNGGATLTNNGLINANSTVAPLTLSVDNITNTGTTQVTNGATLAVNSGNVTTSGKVNVQTGGTATFSQGLTQTAGLTQVDGVLNLANNSALTLNGTRSGGTLDGAGQINGNVVNTNGTVSPGDSPGTLGISGTFTQNSGGTLNIEFTNTSHDLLNVSGLTTTGGLLDVNYLGTSLFTGGIGSSFTFLDYTTLSAPTVGGLAQYFTNEDPLTGIIVGHNGFTYLLTNNTADTTLNLQVLTVGTPAAVPEANSAVGLGFLLALGMGGIVVASKRKKKA